MAAGAEIHGITVRGDPLGGEEGQVANKVAAVRVSSGFCQRDRVSFNREIQVKHEILQVFGRGLANECSHHFACTPADEVELESAAMGDLLHLADESQRVSRQVSL